MFSQAKLIGVFGSEVLSMKLAEEIVYTRAFNSTEISTVETYLNSRYGLYSDQPRLVA